MPAENIFNLIPEDLSLEVFEDIAKGTGMRIERIVSKGHTSPKTGWYDQAETEWVMVLQGSAVIAFVDGARETLHAGDYIEIPAHKKHKVAWTDPDTPTIWLAVFYRSEP